MQAIKIVSVPQGEAPLPIREAWVGLVLPLAEPEIRRIRSAGITDGPKSYLWYLWRFVTRRSTVFEGYLVDSVSALAVLGKAHPEAADWWKQNSPYLLEPGQRFFMQAEFCEPIEGDIWPPAPAGHVSD